MEVKCEYDSMEDTLRTRDISEGGIFVASDQPLLPRKDLRIRLYLSYPVPDCSWQSTLCITSPPTAWASNLCT